MDGESFLSATNSGTFAWQPRTFGEHTLKHVVDGGTYTWVRTVNVTSLVYEEPTPNPPTAEDANISLGSDFKNFTSSAKSSGTITTSGSGTWTASTSASWITIPTSLVSRKAGMPVVYNIAANTSVSPRSGKLTIADHTFTVSQKGRGVTVDYTAKVFDTDGKTMGANSENVVTVTAESDVSWTAVASDPTWIVVYEGASGKGNGTVKYIVAPYVGTGAMRQGTIKVGDQTVYITQRPYDLTIEPTGAWVEGNAGAGEIQVALDINGVLEAFSNDDWISITVSYNEATGRGKVLYTYMDNNSGKKRTGKIIIDGTEYTLEQEARQNIVLTAEVEGHGGKVSGGGTYNIGSAVTLTAVPDAGYVFVGWTDSSGATVGDGPLGDRPSSATAPPGSPRLPSKAAPAASTRLA